MLFRSLLSALVVAVLAITDPKEGTLAALAGPKYEKLLKYVMATYLFAWIATGAAAFIVGVMMYPDLLLPFSDTGKTWLGLAVAGAFAYFKIKPPLGTIAPGSTRRVDSARRVTTP